MSTSWLQVSGAGAASAAFGVSRLISWNLQRLPKLLDPWEMLMPSGNKMW